MAGDWWIKMRCDLADDPAVIAVAAATGLDDFAVVGRLHRLWGWAAKHTADGRAAGVTFAWVDRYVAAPGFAAALAAAGWLAEDAGGIAFPKFDAHNSATAKDRAANTARVQKSRTGRASVAQSSRPRRASVAPKRDESATRGEGEGTEEKKATPPNPPSGGGADGLPPIPAALDTPEVRRAWAEWLEYRRERKPKVTPLSAKAAFREMAEWGPARAVAAIRRSIACGWQGIHESRGPDAAGQLPRPARPPADADLVPTGGVTDERAAEILAYLAATDPAPAEEIAL
jgi:hypothetical protein